MLLAYLTTDGHGRARVSRLGGWRKHLEEYLLVDVIGRKLSSLGSVSQCPLQTEDRAASEAFEGRLDWQERIDAGCFRDLEAGLAGGMTVQSVIERAFSLARSGPYADLDGLKRALNLEGFSKNEIEAHLAGPLIRRQIKKAMAEAPAAVAPVAPVA